MRSFVFLAALGVVAAACTGDPPPEPTTSPTAIESLTAPTATSPPSTTVRETSLAPNSWQQLAPVPTARTEVAVAVHNGLIYVIGGFDVAGRTVDTVEVYDIGSNTWNGGPPLPIAVNHAMAASVDGRLYISGGYTNGLQEATDKVFELEDGGWREADHARLALNTGSAR